MAHRSPARAPTMAARLAALLSGLAVLSGLAAPAGGQDRPATKPADTGAAPPVPATMPVTSRVSFSGMVKLPPPAAAKGSARPSSARAATGHPEAGHPTIARFLVVDDAKADNPDGHRFGLVEFEEGTPKAQPVYRPLIARNFPFPPNDLEAVCRVLGSADEVLAIEGGLRKDGAPAAGRRLLWRLKLRTGTTDPPSPDPASPGPAGSELAAAGPVAVEPVGEPLVMPDLPDEVEGLACLPGEHGGGHDGGAANHGGAAGHDGPGGHGRSLLLLVGLRGGEGRPAELRRLVLSRKPAVVRAADDGRPLPLVPPAVGWRATAGPRGCADLLLVDGPAGGLPELLAVAADDPGDLGPFQSVVYRVGRVRPDGSVLPATGPRTVAVLQGLKVEALAEGVVTAGGGKDQPPVACPYTVGTDDEAFGGIWRPIAPADAR